MDQRRVIEAVLADEMMRSLASDAGCTPDWLAEEIARVVTSVSGTRHDSNMRSTSNPTPKQLRALAGEAGYYADWAASNRPDEERADFEQFRDALGAAADQLEAVQMQRDQWADRVAAVERVADTAQDDEDGNGWVSVDPLLDALYPEKRNARG